MNAKLFRIWLGHFCFSRKLRRGLKPEKIPSQHYPKRRRHHGPTTFFDMP